MTFSFAEFLGKFKQLFRDLSILSGNETRKTVNLARGGSTINNYHIGSVNIVLAASSSDEEQLEFDESKGTLRIPYTEDTRDEVVRIIQEVFSDSDKGSIVARQDIYEIRREYYEHKASSDSNELLTFYRGIIPDADIPILRASLFIRERAEQRENVRKHKRDLTERYGERGRHICNMVTAGYFDTFLPKLYAENEPEFRRLYPIIVTENPLAVFVSDPQNLHQVIQDIKRSVKAAIKYRITDSVNVHAFGHENVLKVERVLTAPEFELFRADYRIRYVERRDSHMIVKFIPRGSTDI